MRNRAIRPALIIAILASFGLLFAPSAALASCMLPAPIENAVKTADIVFVGTVTGTAEGNRWATVTVEEIWRGPDQPRTVVIRGGPGGNTATSVDRAFEPGVRYLFFPIADEAAGLSDNSCTNTTPWAEAMVALRPADARQPVGAAPTTGGGFDFGSLAPVGVPILVFAVLLGVGLLARGRQES